MGNWLIRISIAAILIVIAVGYHTQAPLTSLRCQVDEQQASANTTPENCAAFDILFLRSWDDLRLATGEFITRNRDDIAALSTVIIAIFTGTLWWSTTRLWRATDKLVMGAEDTAERQLRAYVSLRVTKGTPPRFDARTGPWIAFDLRNAGETPAFELAHWSHAAIGPPSFTGPFQIPDKGEILHKSTLAPGTEINFIVEGPEPQPGHFDAFVRGELATFVWGEITYVDAFKNPRFHKFRYIYTASDITAGVQGVRFCEQGNEAN